MHEFPESNSPLLGKQEGSKKEILLCGEGGRKEGNMNYIHLWIIPL